MPSEACLFQTAFDFQGFAGGRGRSAVCHVGFGYFRQTFFFGWNRIFLVCPSAQVDQFAALRTEGAECVFRFPYYCRLTGRTFDLKACLPRFSHCVFLVLVLRRKSLNKTRAGALFSHKAFEAAVIEQHIVCKQQAFGFGCLMADDVRHLAARQPAAGHHPADTFSKGALMVRTRRIRLTN